MFVDGALTSGIGDVDTLRITTPTAENDGSEIRLLTDTKLAARSQVFYVAHHI
jgi:hypothetical protein